MPLRDERERVLAFIGEHALRFAKSYLPGHDYYVRYDALDVMELIGTDTDVPLVEKLIEDGRQYDLYRLQYKSAGFGAPFEKSLSRFRTKGCGLLRYSDDGRHRRGEQGRKVRFGRLFIVL